MAKQEQDLEKVTTTSDVAGITAAYYKEQGAKSKKLIADGKTEGVTVSLTNTTEVRFIKDFGKHLKEGDELTVSDVAYAIYDKAGVIEKV